jgi:hypothetical protein
MTSTAWTGSGTHRPQVSPNATRTEVVGKIIYLRQHYHFGPAKIAMYLRRYHDIQISHSACDLTRRSRLPWSGCLCLVMLSGCAAMPMPTVPLARLGAFRAELHACFPRRADALFQLSDAVLCAEAFSSLPHLSLEPAHQRGWASSDAALARGRIDPSGSATCWSAAGQTPTRWSSPWT